MPLYQYSMTTEAEKNASEHFKVKEFACHDGSDYVPIDKGLLIKLEALRAKLGHLPIHITSGYRSTEYNNKIGGAKNSYHTCGKAVDIYIKGKTPAQIAHAAQPLWFGGIGLYDDFVHLDTRSNMFYWKGHEVKETTTFGNFVSFKISDFKNLKCALLADGWDLDDIENTYTEQLENCLRYCTISRNSTGNMTKLVQFCVGAFPDGNAGKKTQDAIITWQKSNSLTPDGVFGFQCWKKAISKGA